MNKEFGFDDFPCLKYVIRNIDTSVPAERHRFFKMMYQTIVCSSFMKEDAFFATLPLISSWLPMGFSDNLFSYGGEKYTASEY